MIPCLCSLPSLGISFTMDGQHSFWNLSGRKPVIKKIIHIPSLWAMIKCPSFFHTVLNIFPVGSSPLCLQRCIHTKPPFLCNFWFAFCCVFLMMSQDHSCPPHLRLTDLPIGWGKQTLLEHLKGSVLNWKVML